MKHRSSTKDAEERRSCPSLEVQWLAGTLRPTQRYGAQR